jgi:hypothetical protein
MSAEPGTRRAEQRNLKQGRVAFRSATEKDAFELVMMSAKQLRDRLPTERRIKVLMIALEHLETSGFKTAAGLIHKRLQRLCAKQNTAITIRFKDGGQDFSEWDINSEGCVIDSRPCQAFAWCGVFVMNYDKLKVGGTVKIFRHDVGMVLMMNYRIAILTTGPAPIKYPDHKPDNMVLHDAAGTAAPPGKRRKA